MCMNANIEEKWLKDIPEEEYLKRALEFFEEAEFKFISAVNQFRLYINQKINKKPKKK